MTILFAVILALAGTPQATPLDTLIDRVDRTFASMKDFSAEFVQISKNSVNHSQQDEGLLYLTRDRKMSWEYRKPEEKLFVSNGKTLFSYIPLIKEARKEQVKDSLAERIPIMFLVGRAGLRREFSRFEESKSTPLIPGNRVIQLIPKKKDQAIERMEIEVDPRTNLIARMLILETDKSSNEWIFMKIQVNSNIPASKFEFVPPPGTRIVQGEATP